MAQRYNTGNPRPSNSMKDLNDNALAYDYFLNSEADTFVDRMGNIQDSLRGEKEKIAAAGAAVVDETRRNLIPLSNQYVTLADAQADNSSSVSVGGDGASSQLGGGGIGSGNSGTTGTVGSGFGAGGGNARQPSSSAINGYPGASGIIIISEYA